ncbi:MAG: FtsW/RodA/SpoVE family cell cycle protein [Phycisphaerales bacterium]|nr:FtsW/RodA/SpoVE family cell cycle protein [Phycisphaerales bacterium]MCB9836974.1 FtsW/RodA/SpoVE family cell cycle protein [Phycisphaera sp.]
MNFALIESIIRGGYGGTGSLRRNLSIVHWGWVTLLASLALSLIGLYAIDIAEAATIDRSPSGTTIRQAIFLGVGVGAALFWTVPHFRLLRFIAWPAYIACIGLLVFLLVPFVPESIVTPRNGARGWINMGVTDFQPAEVTKIAFTLTVAGFLRYRREHTRLRGLIAPGLIAAVPVGLITLQPDLGSASLFVPSLFAMLLAGGARLRHLVLIVLIATAAAPASWPLLRPHQKTRIVAIMQQIRGSDEGAQDINFQSFTAQRLVGAGRLTGNSDASSRALVRYNGLPEAHNDMVFAVICLRFGLLGGVAVLLLYLIWAASALMTAWYCREPFGRVLIVGLTAFIATQALINIGMTVGLVPIIGITLPFVSYGGSSMLTSWLMTGLVMNVGFRRPDSTMVRGDLLEPAR